MPVRRLWASARRTRPAAYVSIRQHTPDVSIRSLWAIARRTRPAPLRGLAQFICFTCTKVQILTQKALLGCLHLKKTFTKHQKKNTCTAARLRANSRANVARSVRFQKPSVLAQCGLYATRCADRGPVTVTSLASIFGASQRARMSVFVVLCE